MPLFSPPTGNTDDGSRHGGSVVSDPANQGLLRLLDHDVDPSFLSCKRCRTDTPCARCSQLCQGNQISIDNLPDECLFEILGRLPGSKERSICACVSKRWLSILISTLKAEFTSEKSITQAMAGISMSAAGEGLSRIMDGKSASDIRLMAMAVGASSNRGLANLGVRGGSTTKVGVTDVGLKAITHVCYSLNVLSLCNLPCVGDEGLIAVANGCPLLRKLDIICCAAISDMGLSAIATECHNLSGLMINSCPGIGDASLIAIGKHCKNLSSISIKNCPFVGDDGVGALFPSASDALGKVRLCGLYISDTALALIGQCGNSIYDLALLGLPKVSEMGFWMMGSSRGLQNLKSLTVGSCPGFSDVGFEAIGKGGCNLKIVYLRNCPRVSDHGLIAFAGSSASLESIKLEGCHRVTQVGFFYYLCNAGMNLRSISLSNCFGIKEVNNTGALFSACSHVRSLTVCGCPGFGDRDLAVLGKLCPNLQNLELTGLQLVTDVGIFSLLSDCRGDLMKVILSGCVHLSNNAVSEITRAHGWTLEVLDLDGCVNVANAALKAIADNCLLLNNLNVSGCNITDKGIEALTSSKSRRLCLQILSLEGCYMLTDAILVSLLKLGNTLLGLNLRNCDSISSKTLDILSQLLWKCAILS